MSTAHDQADGLPFRPDAPWLAPLAGWSDLPFRLLCRERGAAVCCTEMISAKGLWYGGRNTEELLATTPEDAPLVAQIFGDEPEIMADAVRRLQDRGFVWFDVNMGCSVPKVTKTGSGAALLKDPARALAVGEAVIRAAGERRAGFKMRLGWDAGCGEVFRDLGARLAGAGAGWLTLHPRWARQGFTGEARLDAVAELAAAVPVPVIASGDLFTAEDGMRALREGGAATVMYARGALRDPGVFARHIRLLQGECEPDETDGRAALAALIRRHMELARQHAPASALLKMRTFGPRYVKNLDSARALRQALVTCASWDGLESIVHEYLD